MQQNKLQTDKNIELYYVYLSKKDTCLDSQMLCKMSFFHFLWKGGVIPSFELFWFK